MNILDYIKGSKHGKDAHNFEEKVMRDPFLAEAMEGYDKVKGNHDLIVTNLRKKIEKKTKRRRFRLPKFLWSGIIASVAIICFLAFYFLGGFHLNKNNPVKPKPEKYLPTSPAVDSAKTQKDSVHIESHPVIFKKVNIPKFPVRKEDKSTNTNSPATPKPQVLLPKKSQSTNQTPVIIASNEAVNPLNPEPKRPSTVTDNSMNNSDRIIKGKVVDKDGKPLTGAKISTTYNSTLSDISGDFSLKIAATTQLVSFSYLGYETIQRQPNELKNQVKIVMKEADEMLDGQEIICKDAWKSKSTTKKVHAEPSIGEKAYKNYIDQNKLRSASGDCKSKHGKVKIQFSTDEKGHPVNIHVIKPLCDDYDNNAILLINHGAAWTPNADKVEYEVVY